MEEIAELIREIIEEEKKKHAPHPKSYGAAKGSKRAKKLHQTTADLERAEKDEKSGDPEKRKAARELEKRAYARRERMEKKEREKSGWENKPRPDTQTESVEDFEPVNEEFLELIRELIEEALSAKTKATLRKKAKKRGLTPGSVEAEYKKGLAAWGTSGSRKGMSQHQWAMARVAAATPSKPWATVKKSKAKKK